MSLEIGSDIDILEEIHNNNLASIENIMKYSKDFNLDNKFSGYTPLHAASLKGDALICEYLLKEGANLEVPSNNGNRALHFAALRGHLDVVRLFLSKSVDTSVTNNDGLTPASLAFKFGFSKVALLIERHSNYLLLNSYKSSESLHNLCGDDDEHNNVKLPRVKLTM